MPRLRFTADFDFKPKAAVTIAYRAGQEALVPQACAGAALARGVAVEIEAAPAQGIAETIRHHGRRRARG